jgi:oligopeptide transport system substrate-binding protein
MQFNVAKNKYLANANVRKALSLAVNRKGLTSSLGGNSPCQHFDSNRN